ncbi:MAG: hypothetical protein MR295_08095 [Ruminococcus bromii]|nr:hypothetical protein [Ruminococcus bromii]
MARYRVEEQTERPKRLSVTTLLFPLLSVLYGEAVFAFFAQTGFTVYKVLFALAAGCIALALSRLTPFYPLYYFLQSVWLLLCWGIIAGQYLYFRLFGAYFELRGEDRTARFLSALPAAIVQNVPFLLCMLVPVLLHFTLQRVMLRERRSLMGYLLGANWLEPIGALLLAAILGFVSVVLGLYDTQGEESPCRLLDTHFAAEPSVEAFGAVPELALDVKYNVLGIAGEEMVRYYVVYDGGESVALESAPEEMNS